MADSPLLVKSKVFALDIIRVCNEIKQSRRESVLTNQLIRSGTSIGANIREAFFAHGKAEITRDGTTVTARIPIAEDATYGDYTIKVLGSDVDKELSVTIAPPAPPIGSAWNAAPPSTKVISSWPTTAAI